MFQSVRMAHEHAINLNNYTTGKKYGIFWKHNGNSRIWHFDLLEKAWHQPQTSSVTLMQLSL